MIFVEFSLACCFKCLAFELPEGFAFCPIPLFSFLAYLLKLIQKAIHVVF